MISLWCVVEEFEHCAKLLTRCVLAQEEEEEVRRENAWAFE